MSISCTICFEHFDTKPENEQKHPQTFCRNHHIFCKCCCAFLEDCPICQSKQLTALPIETEVQKIKDNIKQLLNDIPMIPISQLVRSSRYPFATGSYADVFQCIWNGKKVITVALKQLRIKPKASKMDDIKLEAALCYRINHPNIIAMFGLTTLENKYMGLVMEWADEGSLGNSMEEMNTAEKIKVSICICEGLAYMHSFRIAHLDLQPENVLLFGNKSKAKISDFGTSKVIQTIIASTGDVGNPKYSAPELMIKGLKVLIYTFKLFDKK
jgi:tRNA A-37 threonylcarbamoyl transferase component Bud32